uniref:Metallo-hydrolase/oxidoreductase n=1 Tax=Mycena chlorophos TaxID=658473 RepID=A0ABQ0M7J8_MYCCL|nr:metallo-hydrolase/oxidoreductase [Mycena chlorophos]
MLSSSCLGIPQSHATVSVKLFDAVPPGKHHTFTASTKELFAPVLPGHEHLASPIFFFLVEHTSTKKRVMFDLGPRKDREKVAPDALELTLKTYPAQEKDAVEFLEEIGVAADSIDAIIWSHGHIDHSGDPSRFPPSTSLVVSEDLLLATYEENSSSTLLPTDIAGRQVVQITFELQIGAFRAHDYFSDGSFYLLDVPGHQPGHMCGLARVTPTSFVLMGADACHHIGILRPTPAIHGSYPPSNTVLQQTSSSVSKSHFPTKSREDDAFDLFSRQEPMLHIIDGIYQADAALAQESATKLTAFDGDPDVFVVLAHDASMLPLFEGKFPVVLDEWKAKGWKEQTVWPFLDEKNPAFRFKSTQQNITSS